MNPLLSIIIPAYNASEYLDRCIHSILNQMEKANISDKQVEIIVVDDCSTDNTLSILHDLKENVVPNLVIIHHDINRQQGAARNTGLKEACGKYIWFVDVDDSIGDGILCELASPELSKEPDVFQFHAAAILQDNQISIETYWHDVIGPMSGPQFLEFEADHHYTNRIRASWSKWYKREYLLKNDLFYKEGVYWEDVVHTLKCIFLANSIIYKPLIGYNYIHTANSDMRGKQNGKKFADSIRFCADSCKFLIKSEASKKIIESMRPYYGKVLRKYQRNLGQLSFEEYTKFCHIISGIDVSYIQLFMESNEHDWLSNTTTINNLWHSQHYEN